MKAFRTLLTFALGLACLVVTNTPAAEWQWSVPIGNGRAFLWIPPQCAQVRAVVVGQHNMIEEGILQHDYFRKEMAKLGIAEVFIAPPVQTWQSAASNDSANAQFYGMLKSLGTDSGYAELAFAPVIPMGHSAMASYPWNFAAWNPERTLAILSIHGDAPQTTLVGNGRPNVDWGGRRIDGIPGLMAMGEYEWWEDRLTPALKFRDANPGAPVALLADVGHGHFDYSDELVKFLVLFIRKAVEQRLPARSPLDQPVALKPVDPRQDWLVERWRTNETLRAKAAPFNRYAGDQHEAFWCFDREMARATENFNPQHGRLPQLAGFVQAGKIVEQTPDTHEQIRLALPPLDGNLAFKLTGAFLETVPPGGNPAKWARAVVGTPLGHASGNGPVILSRITGPVEQLSTDTFAVRFNRTTVPADRRLGDIWLLASHPGDAKYKSAVQQALLKIPARNNDGTEQHITFPQIPNQRMGAKSVKLAATSDSGTKVFYYVREGPVEIDGDKLNFTRIPPRAKFPLKVTVVAWQYGRALESKMKSAEPVEQSFSITK